MPASSCTSWKTSSWSTRRSGARVWSTRPPAFTPAARSSPTTSLYASGWFPLSRNGDTRINLRVNPQRRSLKGILLLFINPFVAGARDTESYFNPDITKVKVTVNGVPNRIYNEGISDTDMWNELTRYFNPRGHTHKPRSRKHPMAVEAGPT